MTQQELLILSFFDRDTPIEMKDKDLTAEMIEAGIGTNEGATYPYYDIVHQLKNRGLLVSYKDPSKIQKGLTRAVGPDLLILSDNAKQVLQRHKEKSTHQAFVTELEFNKLKTEHDLVAQQLADYFKTKRQAFWAIIISIGSALAAILSLILKK